MRKLSLWEFAALFLLGFLLAMLVSCVPCQGPACVVGQPGQLPALPAQPASLPVPPAMNVTGLVQVNGDAIPTGTPIYAICENSASPAGFVPSSMREGTSVFGIRVLADDPNTELVDGCVDGDFVEFTVDGKLVEQTLYWVSGETVSLDINVSMDGPGIWQKYTPRDA